MLRAERLLIYKRKKEEKAAAALKKQRAPSRNRQSKSESSATPQTSSTALHSRDSNVQPSSKQGSARKQPLKKPPIAHKSSHQKPLSQATSKPGPNRASTTSQLGSKQRPASKKESSLTTRVPSRARSRPTALSRSSSKKVLKAARVKKKVFKFVKIRVRFHSKQRWRDVNTKKASPFDQLCAQLRASFGACAALERVVLSSDSGLPAMKPEFYSADDCTKLEQGAEYIVHSAESKAERELELVRFEAAVRIQAWFRSNVLWKFYQRQRCLAIKLQSIFRAHKARHVAMERRHAIVQLQKNVRQWSKRRQYQELRQATRVLQQRARLRWAIGAAVKLQATVRRFLVLLRVSKWHRAAQAIQKNCRGRRPRKEFRRFRNAAIILQRGWRTFQWHVYEKQCTGAAVVAQKIGRSWLTRQKFYRLERFFRTGLLRLRAHVVRQHRNHCATLIQKTFLQHLKKLCTAATIIEKTFRGHTTRQIQRGRRAFATVAQAAIRGFFVRRRVDCMQQASTAVQRIWRGFSKRRNFQIQRKNTVQCQACVRMLLARSLRWRLQRSVGIVHRFMRWQQTAEEGSFNRRVFGEKNRLDQRMQTREVIKNKIAASNQRKQDDMLGKIQRVEARAKAHGMDVRPGEGRRFLEVGMFCSPTRTPRARQKNGTSATTPGLSLDEKVLMNEADVERDENLLSCCQTYLSQLKSVLRLQHQLRQNKRHGQLPSRVVARMADELNIANEIRLRAREHIEILWGVTKRRTQRRESLF